MKQLESNEITIQQIADIQFATEKLQDVFAIMCSVEHYQIRVSISVLIDTLSVIAPVLLLFFDF